MLKINYRKNLGKIIFVLLVIFSGCSYAANEMDGDISGNEKLLKHSEEFTPYVYQVTDNVWCAVGYGLANSIMIEGDNGLIIIDTMESNDEAEKVLKEFRKISSKPVTNVILTHNHTDHVMGTQAYSEGQKIEIYGHETLDGNFQRIANKMRPIVGTRSLRMFGTFLTPDELVNSGIGPFLAIDENTTMGYMRPTVTFSDKLEVTIEGQKIELIYARGETDDQIYVYLPEQNALFCGDNYYKSFPNLYTIRGTTFRSLEKWFMSIDQIREIKPEHLIPSHSRPVSGKQEIYDRMTNYRDAIQYVHDQGIRGINSGYTPDELVEYVKLPRHLAELPYLQEFYGKVSWSLRSLFTGNLGWFSGDSADLSPLTREKQDQMIIDLAGSWDALMEKAENYASNNEYQATLQLSGTLIRTEPGNGDAIDLRIKALVALGEMEYNANARHYYLTEAYELREGRAFVEEVKVTPEILEQISIDSVMKMLPVGLKAEKTLDMEEAVTFNFIDINRIYSIIIRHGVAEVVNGNCENPDIIVNADSLDFIGILAQIKKPVITLSGFDYEKGGAIRLAAFLNNFGTQEQKLACFPVDK